MAGIDIDTLTFADLLDLRGRVEDRLKGMRESNVNQLRMRFADEAAIVGLTMDDVMRVQKKRRGRKPNGIALVDVDST